MKRRRLQLSTTRLQSLLLETSQRLRQFSLAIVLSGLLLLSNGLLLPLSAMAQPTALTVASGVVGSRTVFANQPLASATIQMPSIVGKRLRQDLSKRTNIPPAKLKLIATTPKTWKDGCFGLAQPDEICTQALVEGWRVVFSNGSQRWIYRADKQGQSYRLER